VLMWLLSLSKYHATKAIRDVLGFWKK